MIIVVHIPYNDDNSSTISNFVLYVSAWYIYINTYVHVYELFINSSYNNGFTMILCKLMCES